MTARYACPVIDELWTTDEAKIRWWLLAWEAGLAGAGHPMKLTGESGHAWTTQDVLEAAAELEERFGHDIAAAAEAVRAALVSCGRPECDEAARWLHYGLCSSDVADVGLLMTVRACTQQLWELASVASNMVAGLGAGHAVYRTHGQEAQVAPASYRWAGLRFELDRATAVVLMSVPMSIGFNGPTGTGEAPEFNRHAALDMIRAGDPMSREPIRLSALDGLQARNRDDYAQWLTDVARLATACERFGTAVRLLAHAGVDEVREGRGPEYRGSSSMPHKQNPTRSERLCGLAPVVRGLASGYAEAAASCWDSHSLEHSSAERVTFPLVTSLVGFMLTEVASIAASLQFDFTAQRINVENAPADSFVRRNELIASGADGGEAWLAAKPLPGTYDLTKMAGVMSTSATREEVTEAMRLRQWQRPETD